MRGTEATKRLGFSEDVFVVETQRTRGGERGGQKTRPYRFADFDLLAVSLSPATGDWTEFRYTVARWLIPDPVDGALICKYQPIPPAPNADWSNDLAECIAWFRSGPQKTIGTRP